MPRFSVVVLSTVVASCVVAAGPFFPCVIDTVTGYPAGAEAYGPAAECGYGHTDRRRR